MLSLCDSHDGDLAAGVCFRRLCLQCSTKTLSRLILIVSTRGVDCTSEGASQLTPNSSGECECKCRSLRCVMCEREVGNEETRMFGCLSKVTRKERSLGRKSKLSQMQSLFHGALTVSPDAKESLPRQESRASLSTNIPSHQSSPYRLNATETTRAAFCGSAALSLSISSAPIRPNNPLHTAHTAWRNSSGTLQWRTIRAQDRSSTARRFREKRTQLSSPNWCFGCQKRHDGHLRSRHRKTRSLHSSTAGPMSSHQPQATKHTRLLGSSGWLRTQAGRECDTARARTFCQARSAPQATPGGIPRQE